MTTALLVLFEFFKNFCARKSELGHNEDSIEGTNLQQLFLRAVVGAQLVAVRQLNISSADASCIDCNLSLALM